MSGTPSSPAVAWHRGQMTHRRERRECREEKEKDSVLASRGMGILPMIPTGVQCCRLCNAAPPWRDGSPEGVSPSAGAGCPRYSQRDAGDTCASPRALRALRFHPQPPVTEALLDRKGFGTHYELQVASMTPTGGKGAEAHSRMASPPQGDRSGSRRPRPDLCRGAPALEDIETVKRTGAGLTPATKVTI